jgi:CRP-like cAMP-binding protein
LRALPRLAALEIELEQLQPTPPDKQRQKPKRAPFPPHLRRTDIHHEPDDLTSLSGCQRGRLAEMYGDKREGGTLTSIALTREQIAAMMGASRVTVTRALKRLTTLGAVEPRQRHIWVLDPSKLLG